MREPRWRRYLRFWGEDPPADLDDELSFHLAERTRLNQQRGMPRDLARADAERRFGDLDRIRRQCIMEHEQHARRRALADRTLDLGRDIRLAARSLVRAPVYSVTAGIALALGIGASTAVFSTVSAVLLRPLPYAEPDGVVAVHNTWDGTPEGRISPAEYLDFAERARAFAAHGVYARAAVNIVTGDAAERVPALVATPSTFEALGVGAAHGRLFTDSDATPGSAPVAVLSHEYWQQRFNGDPDLIGSDLIVNSRATTVIGVLPPGVRAPATYADADPPVIIVPYSVDRASAPARGSHFLFGVARLAPGWTAGTASTEVSRIAQELVRDYPDDYPQDMAFDSYVRPVHAEVVGSSRALLLLLAGAVGMVLLIACANVSSLVLTRAEERRREMAVRSALGAGRGRITSQLLLEHLVLAVAAGAAGLLIAQLSVQALLALQPQNLPRLGDVRLDARALVFLACVSVAATLLAAVAPLRFGAASHGALREAGARTTAGRTSHRIRRILITAQVALSIVLLAGAGLLLRSFTNLVATDTGYRTEQVLTVPIALPAADYPDDDTRRRFFAHLVQQAAQLPGVAAAGAVSNLPLDATVGDLGIQIEGRETGDGDVSNRLDWQIVTPGWFDAMGIDIVQGLPITSSDDDRAIGAVVLSESAAAKYWPDGDALGRRFQLGGGAGPGWVTVIGIARDVRQNSVDAAPPAVMYLPHAQFTMWGRGAALPAMSLVLHTTTEPFTVLPALRRLVGGIDPNVPLGAVRTMDQVFSRAVAEPRFMSSVLAGLAALALGLAMIGIYGLVAYAVARRTREIAVRMALGAEPRNVVQQMVREGMAPVAAGAAIGLAAAFALTGTLEGMLYNVTATDPATLATATALLIGTAGIAAFLPARRAARLDPGAALR